MSQFQFNSIFLDELLGQPEDRRVFLSFMKQEIALDLPIFLMAAAQFRAQPTVFKAMTIEEQMVRSGAPYELNLANHERDAIRKLTEQGSVSPMLFHKLARQIESVMYQDNYSRFHRMYFGSHNKQLLKQAKEQRKGFSVGSMLDPTRALKHLVKNSSLVKTLTHKSSPYEKAIVQCKSFCIPAEFNGLHQELKNAGFDTKAMMFVS